MSSRRVSWTLSLLLFLFWFGGGCAGPAEEDCALTGSDRTFGQCCVDNGDCASEICHTFGDGGPMCSEPCTSDDVCPEGSRGKKCNVQGICRP